MEYISRIENDKESKWRCHKRESYLLWEEIFGVYRIGGKRVAIAGKASNGSGVEVGIVIIAIYGVVGRDTGCAYFADEGLIFGETPLEEGIW